MNYLGFGFDYEIDGPKSWVKRPKIFGTGTVIPTRQIQIYGGVFEVVLQEKLSQIC